VLQLSFDAATTVTVDWGDGTSDVYNAVLYQGYYQVRLVDIGSTQVEPPYPMNQVPHVYAGAAGQRHTINVYYPPPLLHGLFMNFINMPTQDLAFGFSKHSNLVSFSINNLVTTTDAGVGALRELDMLNINYLNNFTGLGINNVFNKSSQWYGSLPVPLLKPPLTNLTFGDTGFIGKNFTENNMNSLPLATTITAMTMYWAIHDTNGTAPGRIDGALPDNFHQLTKMTSFIAFANAWTKPPDKLRDLPWLTVLGINFSRSMTGWGDLSTLTKLTNLSFAATPALPLTIPAWLANMPLIKNLNMQGSFPASGFFGYRAGAINTFVTNLHAFVLAHVDSPAGAWRNVKFDIGKFADIAADIPNAAAIALLTDLETTYGWDCNWAT
jgi:hypothetical protein